MCIAKRNTKQKSDRIKVEKPPQRPQSHEKPTKTTTKKKSKPSISEQEEKKKEEKKEKKEKTPEKTPEKSKFEPKKEEKIVSEKKKETTKEFTMDEQKQSSLWGWLKPKSSYEKAPTRGAKSKSGNENNQKVNPSVSAAIPSQPAPKRKQTSIPKKSIHVEGKEDDRSVNDKTEFLENAQLTKLMSNADIRAALGGPANHDTNDETSCRDTIDEVDSEMQDIIFSPLLASIQKEELRPIKITGSVCNMIDSMLPLHISKKESKEK